MSLILYETGAARSIRCRWMLRELGIPFETTEVNLRDLPQGYKDTLHPLGKIPVLKDGDFTVFESVAICTYLADKHPEKNLVPKVGTKERALYDQWNYFTMTELEAPLWQMTLHTWIYPDEMKIPATIEPSRHAAKSVGRIFEKELSTRTHILGDAFSAADIILGYTLMWGQMFELFNEMPSLQKYIDTLKQRPAFPHDRYK